MDRREKEVDAQYLLLIYDESKSQSKSYKKNHSKEIHIIELEEHYRQEVNKVKYLPQGDLFINYDPRDDTLFYVENLFSDQEN